MSQIQTIYAPKTEKQLNEVYSQLERHQQKILELSKMSIDFYGGKNANNPAQMKAMSEQIDKLNKKIKEQNDALKKLQTTQAKVVVSKSKIERANQKQLATNEKNYRVNKKLASAWTQ